MKQGVRQDWMPKAACLRGEDTPNGVDIFFGDSIHEDGRDAKVSEALMRHAISICRTQCAVRSDCLAIALDNDEQHGVWGGYTAKERKALRDGRTQPKGLR